MMPLGPVLLSLLALTPAELETRASRQVLVEFERVGRTAPANDAALSKAARLLAAQALSASVADAADLLAVTQAVSDSGGFDPSPRALIVRGSPHEEPLRSMLARKDLPDDPASHCGVGASVKGQSAALVVLLSERKAQLDAFPHALPKAGVTRPLCAELPERFLKAELYVTRPSGQVDKLPSARDGGKFCGAVPFPTTGQHTVELIGRADRGPEVLAMFFVQVGAALERAARAVVVEPTTEEAARAEVVSRVNALRRANGLPEVTPDAALDAVAQAYSERMARENFFAHVAPDGSDLRGRMTRAGYRYQAAGENLGMAAGPIAAHFGIEHSPGHRKNLLDPVYTRLGVGVTFKALEGRTQVLVTEVLAAPPDGEAPGAAANPVEAALHAIDKERATLKLAALKHSDALSQVAREHLRRALELGEPSTRLPGFSTSERVFAAEDDVATAAVDLFVAESAALVTDSKNLAEPANDRVGVAVQLADSPKYGKGRYWVVVIYASPR